MAQRWGPRGETTKESEKNSNKKLTVTSWNWSEKQGSGKKRNRGFWFSEQLAVLGIGWVMFLYSRLSAWVYMRTFSIDIVDCFSTLLFICYLIYLDRCFDVTLYSYF